MRPPREATRRETVKVLYCEGNTDGTIGGSYYSLLYLLEGLKGTGFRPVVVFHAEHPLLPRFSEAGAEVHVIPQKPSVRVVWGSIRGVAPLVALSRQVQRARNFFRFLSSVRDRAAFLRRHGVALLHLNNSVTRGHDWMLAAALRRTPCVVHERGIKSRYEFLARRLAPRLSRIICISEAVRDNLLQHGVARTNLTVVYNGLDPRRVVPARTADVVRQSLGLATHHRIVGLIGNIREWKGQEVLVKALPVIVARCPDVVCLFVGAASDSDGPYLERLRELTCRLGVERHVVFTGFCLNAPDYLNIVDIVVHASILPEPFGRVLLEAMAMRKPTIASRSGAVPEIVQHGVTGLTFAPGNSGELGSAVIELLERTDKARAFGEAGYQRLVEHFHISTNISRTLSLYDAVLGRVPQDQHRA